MARRRDTTSQEQGRAAPAGERWFAELVPGLEAPARAELQRLGARRLEPVADGVRFEAAQPARLVREARLVAAFYLALDFAVPRPKALLGDAAFRRLSEAVARVAGPHGRGTPLSGGPFDGLRLAAAGAGSPVMLRLGEALAGAAGLGFDPEAGELVVRLRPGRRGGWEVLVRLTPRPSSARAWRVCNRAGGLNAVVAAAMNELVGVRPDDRYLNLMCGSGTLLVERALAGPARRLVGVDLDPAAVTCAERNLQAAGAAERCELLAADVAELDAGLGRFDVVVADAPWGDAVGEHDANRRLYPLLLERAAALAAPGARFALLTHEVRLARRLLPAAPGWELVRELQVAHGGHNPLLLLLGRR